MLHRFCLAALLLVSCASRREAASRPAAAPEPAAATKAEPTVEAKVPDRKIVHTGTLRLTVSSCESARQEIEAMVTAAGGFVGAARVQHGEGKVTAAEMTLRVPAGKFAEVARRISQLGHVVEESLHADDVTEAWVDLEARLKNARQMEGRLLEIVARGPAKVSDLLEVERELGRVRGEIEAYDGRMRVMKDQVELGTLELGVYSDIKLVPPTVGARAVGTLSRSWHAMLDLGEALLFVGLALLPWLPVMGLAYLVARRLWKRARRPARVA